MATTFAVHQIEAARLFIDLLAERGEEIPPEVFALAGTEVDGPHAPSEEIAEPADHDEAGPDEQGDFLGGWLNLDSFSQAAVETGRRGWLPSTPTARIVTLYPRSYREADEIGESFRSGLPVIMNLTEVSEADAKRLVDFAAGLVFSARGSIDRVTEGVFLITPPQALRRSDDQDDVAGAASAKGRRISSAEPGLRPL